VTDTSAECIIFYSQNKLPCKQTTDFLVKYFRYFVAGDCLGGLTNEFENNKTINDLCTTQRERGKEATLTFLYSSYDTHFAVVKTYHTVYY